MEQTQPSSDRTDWLEASGLRHLMRIARYAMRVDNLAIGVGAIVLTVALGAVLNGISATHNGLSNDAIEKFIDARRANQPYEEPKGDHGIFYVLSGHEQRSIQRLLGSSFPGRRLASGTRMGVYLNSESPARPLHELANMCWGSVWLLRHHPIYGVIFAIGMLAIWSLCGGAICRIAAVHFARDEMLGAKQGLVYAKKKLLDGFVLAPCVPAGLILFIMFLMVLGGMLLRVPVLGDLVSGVTFVLAIVGGLAIAGLLVALLVGGHLFWPAVAVDGADGFDAFSRSLSYVFSKPWKTFFYAVVALLYTAVVWVLVHLFTYLALSITRAVVAFGTSPFGWWSRTVGDVKSSKMALLWPLAQDELFYTPPVWGNLGVFEHVSAVLIGFWVLLIGVLVWSFLASLYFSSCTVIYFLLRKDVDGIDLDDVQMEEAPADEAPPVASPAPEPESPQEAASPAKTDESPAQASTSGPAATPATEAESSSDDSGSSS